MGGAWNNGGAGSAVARRSILVNMRAYTPLQTPRAEWPCRARRFPGELQSARGKLCGPFFHDPLGSSIEAHGNTISRALWFSLDPPP